MGPAAGRRQVLTALALFGALAGKIPEFRCGSDPARARPVPAVAPGDVRQQVLLLVLDFGVVDGWLRTTVSCRILRAFAITSPYCWVMRPFG
jgi:hypothetical protein